MITPLVWGESMTDLILSQLSKHNSPANGKPWGSAKIPRSVTNIRQLDEHNNAAKKWGNSILDTAPKVYHLCDVWTKVSGRVGRLAGIVHMRSVTLATPQSTLRIARRTDSPCQEVLDTKLNHSGISGGRNIFAQLQVGSSRFTCFHPSKLAQNADL
ncbi:hypothetical protein K438DRAFT_1789464 [Mycena galopus ATCC 62051]|nr:hypothetical protein K438DRAFT_1789464 [Mycena galopus ATCC 62051]